MHLSALQQSTGEAVYVDDMPSYKDELHAAVVVSSRPHAEIVDIDISEAAIVEGFVDFVCAKDIPEGGRNLVATDEEVFANDKVLYKSTYTYCIICNRPTIYIYIRHTPTTQFPFL